jgi:N-acetylglutamate synthase-like GNAT family acetyltransferase
LDNEFIATIRHAAEADFPAVRAIIHDVQINPTGLDWHRFLVAIDPEGEVIGCGQIKPHRDGSDELASIAVVPRWRKNGIARKIIEELVASHPDRLYLTCREHLGPFYEQFGFMAIEEHEMTAYFRRIKRITRWLSAMHVLGEGLLVMMRE